jgi:hypothetical protein
VIDPYAGGAFDANGVGKIPLSMGFGDSPQATGRRQQEGEVAGKDFNPDPDNYFRGSK